MRAFRWVWWIFIFFNVYDIHGSVSNESHPMHVENADCNCQAKATKKIMKTRGIIMVLAGLIEFLIYMLHSPQLQ